MTIATIEPFSLEGFRGLQSNPKSRANFQAESGYSGLYPVKFCASPRFELLYIVRSDRFCCTSQGMLFYTFLVTGRLLGPQSWTVFFPPHSIQSWICIDRNEM